MSLGARLIIILLWGCIAGLLPLLSGDDQPSSYISGTITDQETGKPIANVNVYIVGTQFGTLSNDDGIFHLGPFDDGLYTIMFSHIAYQNVQDVRLFFPGQTHKYDVQLSAQPILFEEVEITAEIPERSPQWKGISGRVLTREEIENTGARQFGDIIRLMVPGARVRESGPDLFIELRRTDRRGPGTSFDAYLTTPLIIIDGLSVGRSPVGLNYMIQPEEIDEIVVLRELEASMYGHQGRYGVILIKTTPQPDPSGFSWFRKVLYGSVLIGTSFLLSWLLLW